MKSFWKLSNVTNLLMRESVEMIFEMNKKKNANILLKRQWSLEKMDEFTFTHEHYRSMIFIHLVASIRNLYNMLSTIKNHARKNKRVLPAMPAYDIPPFPMPRPTSDLHEKFNLPTLADKYRKCLTKWLSHVQQHEQELIACYLMNKNVVNKTFQHYKEKPCIQVQALPRARPSSKMTKFYDDSTTFLDKLLHFYSQ
jgi:hypothetical protein